MPKRAVGDVVSLTVDEERLKAHMATRSGKWTIQEEQYAEVLADYFRNGWLADCFDGTTLRVYLTIKLGCSPMRVSKKFSGKPLGQTYRKVCVSEERLVILATLRKRFTDSVALSASSSAAPANHALLPYSGFPGAFGYPSSLIAPSLRPGLDGRGHSDEDADGADLFIKEEAMDMDFFTTKRPRAESAVEHMHLTTADEDHDCGRCSFCSAATDGEDTSSCVAAGASSGNLHATHAGNEAAAEQKTALSFTPSGPVWDRLRSLDPLALHSSPMMLDKDFLALMDDLADSVEFGGAFDCGLDF